MDYYEELMNEIEILKLRVEQLTEENRELRRKALDALTEHDQKLGLYEQSVPSPCCRHYPSCYCDQESQEHK